MGFIALPRIGFAVAVLAALVAGTAAGCVHHAATPNATVALTCRATAGQQGADPQALRVNGVESFALRGDSNPADPLPAWRVAGRRYLIWKTFLAVAATARPYRVVTVTSPAAARLYYAAPARWGAVSGRGTIAAAPRQIRLPSCGRRFTGYTGGILVPHPACVRLAVRGPGRNAKAVSVTVPILVAHC
jgi:hypothetical protein